MFDSIISECFLLVVILSGIPLLVSSIAGLSMAILQSATQIQEQTITYLVKFASICLVFIVLGKWFSMELVELITQILSSLPVIGTIS